MAVLIIKGEVKVADRYNTKGEIISMLTAAEEKQLVEAGVAKICELNPDEEVELADMSLAQLKECANGYGIDLKDMTTKAQVSKKIREHFAMMDIGNPGTGAGGA